MRRLKNMSIRSKQTLIIMLTSSVVLLLASAAFVAYDTVFFRRELIENVAVQADAIGNNCAAAIDFNDPKSAGETLAALRANDNIASACVYSRDGQVFAVYQRDAADLFVPPTVSPTTSADYTGNQLHLFRPIQQRGEMIGTIFVASDLGALTERLGRHSVIVGLVFLGSLLLAFLLSARLQRLISGPILHLVQTAHTVASDKNYSVRAVKQSNDELGQLVDGFNEMLAQIQARDSALQIARENLELRVQERTQDLAKANEALHAENTERQRAEQELRRTEELYRRAISGVGAVPYSNDFRTRASLFMGEGIEQLIGYPPQEVNGALWSRIIQKSVMLGEAAGLDKAEAARRVLSGELREWRCDMCVTIRDGQTRWISDVSVQERDELGRPLFSMGILQDITERKRGEAELLESTQFLQSTLDALSAHIAILDETGFVIAVNGAWRQFANQNAFLGVDCGIGANYLQVCDSASGACATEALRVAVGVRSVLARKCEEFHQEYPCHSPKLERWFVVRVTRFVGAGPVRVVVAHENITQRKHAEFELAQMHTQLLEASRRGGMAEVATNVLHNVGNVLNSVNISAGLIVDSVKQSRAASLARVVGLLQEHAHDLGEFITTDANGKHVPAHLAQLSAHLLADQVATLKELDLLRANIEHIKAIVAMQQSYARVSGVREIVNLRDLVEDSLRMNLGSLDRHGVELIREFAEVPPLNVEKHKVLQILVNLIRNAKHACDDSGRADKRMTVRVASGDGQIKISVVDNGVGIPPENLTRIFNHGFTTRKDGHGFGLHSGALAAKEMGGSLTVQSDGPDQGATFTLELPLPDAGERP